MRIDNWVIIFEKIVFTEEEIKKAIWDLEGDKSRGPDDFQIGFFRAFWEFTKEDLVRLPFEVRNDMARLDRLNFSFIILIPKKESPER